MKSYLIIFTLVLAGSIQAQKDTTHIHHFTSGELSTLIVYEDSRKGKARAFDKTGKEIYNKRVRKYAGHATVHFTHYPNGAVKIARYSSAPDGGIQWQRITTEFAEDGTITRETKEDNDLIYNPPHYPLHRPIQPRMPDLPQQPEKPKPKPQPKPEPVKPERKEQPQRKKEVITCASIHQNQIYLVNHTPHTLLFTFKDRGENSIFHLEPDTRQKAVSYITADITQPPQHQLKYSFEISEEGEKSRRKAQIKLVEEKVQKEQLKTEYIFHLFESGVE